MLKNKENMKNKLKSIGIGLLAISAIGLAIYAGNPPPYVAQPIQPGVVQIPLATNYQYLVTATPVYTNNPVTYTYVTNTAFVTNTTILTNSSPFVLPQNGADVAFMFEITQQGTNGQVTSNIFGINLYDHLGQLKSTTLPITVNVLGPTNGCTNYVGYTIINHTNLGGFLWGEVDSFQTTYTNVGVSGPGTNGIAVIGGEISYLP
jgi:hypothetical protein